VISHLEKYHIIKEELFTNQTEKTLFNIQTLHKVEKYKGRIETSYLKIALLEGELHKKIENFRKLH
jgi:hypothetical protein